MYQYDSVWSSQSGFTASQHRGDVANKLNYVNTTSSSKALHWPIRDVHSCCLPRDRCDARKK